MLCFGGNFLIDSIERLCVSLTFVRVVERKNCTNSRDIGVDEDSNVKTHEEIRIIDVDLKIFF